MREVTDFERRSGIVMSDAREWTRRGEYGRALEVVRSLVDAGQRGLWGRFLTPARRRQRQRKAGAKAAKR